MLIPIIKDFNNAFSYLVSNSVEKTKQVFDPVSKSLLNLSEGHQSGTLNDIFQIGWTGIRMCFLFLVQTIQYIVSFQWLRDFAYLPVSIPNNMLNSNETNTFIQNFNNSVVSLVGDRQNVLQRFLFSNQTIAKPVSGLAISDQNLPYHNFILGLPNVSHSGAPINSWSLSFLSNKWFDPLTVPVNFLSGASPGLESSSKTISQLSLPEQITGDFRITNIILMSILICITTGFSSFLNSFFISFPLSLSNLLSLRYLIIQKFWAGCVSVLGIVLGEIVFMLFLILPPPFIQITLVYLESVWPYIIGLSLIVFIIFDLISNPYTNTMSLSQTSSTTNTSPSTKQTYNFTAPPFSAEPKKAGTNLTQFLPIKLGNNTIKIFGFSFLLALTEQSCYFSFFGSLNLSSTGNFLDTYLFAASRSPIILFFSCVGFLTGSFLAITIYNLIIAKTIFLVSSLGIKIKQYNPDFIRNWILNRQNDFKASMDQDSKNFSQTVIPPPSVAQRVYTSLKNIVFRLNYLLSFIKSKGVAPRDFFKSLVLGLKNFLQLFIRYLPGGKRIVFFLFPGQAYSYKSDLKSTSLPSQNLGTKEQLSAPNNEILGHPYSSIGFKPHSATNGGGRFSSIETRIEKMLRTDSLNMSSSPSPSISDSSRDFLNVSGNSSQLGGSAFYNKIDKILLTCLITLSFTTIPYYSFDYLINSFLGFIPQDQILNAHSLRVNFPDYTNLLGITLSDNNSVINTDVSLYDRAHFMYGEWPNSFESLNYQGELMWTNLRDHRRQKRTRRSTRLKFKTLKTKISTSWKEFKRSSGFSGSTSPSSFSEETKWDSKISDTSSFSNQEKAKLNSNANNTEGYENSKVKAGTSSSSGSSTLGYQFDNNISEENRSKASFGNTDIVKRRGRVFNEIENTAAQKYLRTTKNLSNLFYKIFLASPFKGLNENAFIGSNRFDKTQIEPLSETKDISKNQILSVDPRTKIDFLGSRAQKTPEEIRRSTSLSETIKPLSTSTFIDLSGGEKYIKTYPKNWKRVITEKYYQNPIYKTILSNDLKAFLKREPLTQQLTNNQENELYFLRIKMAHYYDSLRFYFTLKDQINSTRPKADKVLKSSSEKNQKGSRSEKILDDSVSISKTKPNIFSLETNSFNPSDNKKDSAARPFEKIWNDKRKPEPSSSTEIKPEPVMFPESSWWAENGPENINAGVDESLKNPPFQFKSMTSMNYRQQFKGTLKTVKQLFAISLPESVSGLSNAQYEQNSWDKDYDFAYKESNQPINRSLRSTGATEPIEKSYKYDKYLFNEYAYPKNEFLHEEGRGYTNRKSNISHFRESSQNSTFSATTTKGNTNAVSRGYRGIGLATKNIYNMFGSNDPFYVGWDQNLRKFVLTSRILSRSSALNYNATNPKPNLNQNKEQKPLDSNNDNSRRSSSISDLTNQIKNKNNKKDPAGKLLDTSSDIPIYSSPAFRSTLSKAKGEDMVREDIKNVQGVAPREKKHNFNQPSVHIYRPYTCWPFFKHQLKNLPNRPYFVLYENYLNILNKRIHLFSNININDIDTKSLTFLYSYSFNNNVKKYVSQLPINIYKQSMRPSSLENLFTPTSNARNSFLWPGSIMPAWEYYFW